MGGDRLEARRTQEGQPLAVGSRTKRPLKGAAQRAGDDHVAERRHAERRGLGARDPEVPLVRDVDAADGRGLSGDLRPNPEARQDPLGQGERARPRSSKLGRSTASRPTGSTTATRIGKSASAQARLAPTSPPPMIEQSQSSGAGIGPRCAPMGRAHVRFDLRDRLGCTALKTSWPSLVMSTSSSMRIPMFP